MTPGLRFDRSLVLGNLSTLRIPGDFHVFPLVFPAGEVISSMSELQRLKVEPSSEKEKQRSEAKHILMQKQRALADLFKHLAKTGKVLDGNPVKCTHLILGRQITWVIWGKFVETVEMVGNKVEGKV